MSSTIAQSNKVSKILKHGLKKIKGFPDKTKSFNIKC